MQTVKDAWSWCGILRMLPLEGEEERKWAAIFLPPTFTAYPGAPYTCCQVHLHPTQLASCQVFLFGKSPIASSSLQADVQVSLGVI